MNEDLKNKIISAAYGDAGLIDKIQIYFLRTKYENVDELYLEYRSTAKAVKKIGKEEIDDSVIEKVRSKIKLQEENSSGFIYDIYNVILNRPVVTTAAVVILIASISYSIIKQNTAVTNYSEQEIELADKQTRDALAIVTKIFKSAEFRIKEDFNTRVKKPINKGLKIVDDLFTEENKNENSI
ncbi:MAG: hypothetical protein PVH88_12380 [Ignavibacteria bacterium]|jgi:hypothetical protein